MNLKFFKPVRAFSLAELTITLAILGVLAVALLPMISNSQAGPRKYTATLKSTMTTIENAVTADAQRGITNTYTILQRNLKPEKLCPTNVSAEGCWNVATQGSTESTEPGMILKNGVAIAGLKNFNATVEGFLIDANGSDGPNRANIDQLSLLICLDAESAACSGMSPGGGLNPTSEYKLATGALIPDVRFAGSQARFNEIME